MFMRKNGSDDDNSHSGQAARFQALVEIIRTEIRVGVDPLRGDVQNLKLSVDEVRRMQREMYTKEVIDLKLKDRDDQLRDIRKGHEDIQAAIGDVNTRLGGFWKQAFLTTAIVLSPIGAIVSLWPTFAHLFR